MHQSLFSTDLWDYLEDMPDLPVQTDRESLVASAASDSRQAKRVGIWDYFFQIAPSNVGRPQKQEIERLRRRKRANDDAARVKCWLLIGLAVVIAIVGLVGRRPVEESLPSAGLLLMVLACLIVSAALYWYEHAHVKAEYELQATESQLNREIADLKRQIPAPPNHQQIWDWLQEDIEHLTQQAIERTGLEARLVELKDAQNPLCILGPAMLQDIKNTPKVFLKHDDERRRHLLARQFVTLPDGTFQDFYGVYYVEFILVAGDMLGNYGCFFDFITGRAVGEHASEQYYRDVVALNIRHEYREFDLDSDRIVIENAPTFGMSLTSGERMDVTFASQEYFARISRQQGNGSIHFDPEQWARNPERTAENAIKALRSHLRKHKGTLGESEE